MTIDERLVSLAKNTEALCAKTAQLRASAEEQTRQREIDRQRIRELLDIATSRLK